MKKQTSLRTILFDTYHQTEKDISADFEIDSLEYEVDIKKYAEEDLDYAKDEWYGEWISETDNKFLREWKDIVKAAETNTLLKDALERVRVAYELGKK